MSAALPLLGVRVIELCWVWSGPLLGQFLADLGAEVIKVEWFKRYDLYRTRGVERMAGKYPEFIRREMSHSFHGLNRNKIGLALDLKEGQHREALLDLVGQSDLVIENFTAGTLDRLGLGYDAMAKANPAVMLLSLSGFGDTSRLGQMRAYGLVLSALSGFEPGIIDPATGEFVGSPTFVASDPNAATYGLFAAITAILEARTTGEGRHMEMSQLEAIAHAATDKDSELMDLAASLGLPTTFASNRTSVLRCKAGEYLCVAWPTGLEEKRIRDLSDVASAIDLAQAQDYLEDAGVQSVRVIEQAAELGTGASRQGTLIPSIHPVTGSEEIVAAPWWIDGQRAPLRKSAPVLGEGNDYVLGFLLDWPPEDREEIMALDMEKRHGSIR